MQPLVGLSLTPTGTFVPSTSLAGTYIVKYTIQAASGCPATVAQATVVIDPIITATTGFTYPSPICKNAVNPSPTFVPGISTGGTFSISPLSSTATGLVINSATGLVDLAASTAGTYIVRYEVIADLPNCKAAGFTDFTITITTPPAAISLSYGAPNYCVSVTTIQTPTQTGGSGGSYSVLPTTGLSLTVSGSFSPNTSTSGTYVISYTIAAAGGCAGLVTNATVVINPLIIRPTGFTYPTPICKNAANPSPTTVTGFSNEGTFGISPVSPTASGLSINTTTGAIDLTASTVGTYIVRYAVAFDLVNCKAAGFTDFQIVITPTTTPVTGFTYVSPVCASNLFPTPIPSTGFEAGGIYTASPAGLSINSATGVVNYALSTPGSYVVTYTTAANTTTCKLTATSTASLILSKDVMPMITGECEGPVFVLRAAALNSSYITTGTTYQWTTSTGALLGTLVNQAVTELGNYSVKVTNSLGCIGTAIINVDAITCSVPKGISVNGDGINDVWDLSGFKVKQLNIFNRYGQKVYSKTDYRKEWVGQSDKGDELPDGTYFYVIERVGVDSVSGWVYVNRSLN